MTDEKLRRLLAEATPGPWTKTDRNNVMGDRGCPVATPSTLVDPQMRVATATLIAAAPGLAAEVLRLRRALRFYAGGEDDVFNINWAPGDDAGATARAALNPEAD